MKKFEIVFKRIYQNEDFTMSYKQFKMCLSKYFEDLLESILHKEAGYVFTIKLLN